ncbi:hypothetical protein [Streptomyces chartreusis]|uniref:hypothetical protein n=1 Tax=Streptomyces chartreusis TaxID=1969 RepID=UPI0036996262
MSYAIESAAAASPLCKEAFREYQMLAEKVTDKINLRSFVLEEDVFSKICQDFVEIVDGMPLRLPGIESEFSSVLKSVSDGATFSWEVTLEAACELTSDLVMLGTGARIAVADNVTYFRVSNLLMKDRVRGWVFLHQHRTEVDAARACLSNW